MAFIETTVVSMHPNGRIVLFGKDQEDCEQYYVIAKEAKNRVENPKCDQFFFGAKVEVYGIRKNLGDYASNEFEPSFAASVLDYSYNDVPQHFLSSLGSPDPRQHIVSVVQNDAQEYVGVVSSVFTEKHYAVGSGGAEFGMFTFAIGYPMQLQPFQRLVTRGSNLWMIKDPTSEKEFNDQWEKSLEDSQKKPALPVSVVTYYDLRPLNDAEKDLVNTKTSNVKDLTLAEAETFIRDPIICSLAAQSFMKREANAPLQLNTPVTILYDDDGTCTVTIIVLGEMFKQLTDIKTPDSWRIGNELVMKHETLLKGNPIVLIFDSYTRYSEDQQYFQVKFMVAPRSDLLIRWLNKKEGYSNSLFIIGPQEDEISSAADALITGFPRFFMRKELFDVWRGYTQQPVPDVIPNSDIPYYVEGKLLDETQLAAVRTAAGVPGFSCITAPPGSGKTFMISGLVKSIEEAWEAGVASGEEDLPKPQFAIASTTNTAVTNALESIHRHYPDMRVCRDYSIKAEEELVTGQTSNDISVKHLIETHKWDEYITDEKYYKIFAKKEELVQDIRNGITKMSIYKGVRQLKDLRKTELELAREFLIQVKPTVYGTTAELMCRADGEQITHLIIDEASQMSQFHALALYCSLPNVTHITLLGDSKQLGPHLVLPKQCEMFSYQQKGELTRLKDLHICCHQELRTVYRCHPMLLDIWLKPIYGDLVSGASSEERNYVKKYNLLQSRLKGGAPTLLVHVPSASGTGGKNKKEADQVFRLLSFLKKRNVPDEDITIICHHRAQREMMINQLRGKGTHGTLGLAYPVHTVDSFQGKEAKIVLVLTTKTTKADDYESMCRALSFVSDENRETVAISRASHAMYIFGDWSKLGRMPFWRQFGPILMEYGAVVDKHYDPIYNPHWFTANDPARGPINEDEGPQKKRMKLAGDDAIPLVSHVNLSLQIAFDNLPGNRDRTQHKIKTEADAQNFQFKEMFSTQGPLKVPETLCQNPFLTVSIPQLREQKPEAMDELPPPPPPPVLIESIEPTPFEAPSQPAVATLIDLDQPLIDTSMEVQKTNIPSIPMEPEIIQTVRISLTPQKAPPLLHASPVAVVPEPRSVEPEILPTVRISLPLKTVQLQNVSPAVVDPVKPSSRTTGATPSKKRSGFVPTVAQRFAVVGLSNDDVEAEVDDSFDDKLTGGNMDIDRAFNEKRNMRTYAKHNQNKSNAAMCRCHKVPCVCDFDKILEEETGTKKGEKEKDTEFGHFVDAQYNNTFEIDELARSWKLLDDLDNSIRVEAPFNTVEEQLAAFNA